MPNFAHLDLEGEVQLIDKTRFDASKCFSTADLPSMTDVLIQPGADESAISVFGSGKNREWVLDWQFESWKMDVDSSNNKLDFSRGGSVYAATLTPGSYDLSGLAAEIQLQMNNDDANSYVVSVDADDKITIAGSANFELLPSTGANRVNSVFKYLYFKKEDLLKGAATYTSGRTESLVRAVNCQAGANVFQKQTIKCVADVSDSLNNKYFLIDGPLGANKYYVWFDTGAGVDPVIFGRTSVQVVIATNDSAATVASALQAALDALSDLDATVSTDTVTVTAQSLGYAAPAEEGLGTGFVFTMVDVGEKGDSKNFYIRVYSELGDSLFSSDAELVAHESDIMKWVKPGRSTFKNVHRKAQSLIMAWLDKEGYVDDDLEKFSKWAIVDHSEVNTWSLFMALRLIFEANTTAPDDILSEKAKRYKGLEVEARNRYILRIDEDGDGKVDKTENLGWSTSTVVRR